jgi:hypothetical protein
MDKFATSQRSLASKTKIAKVGTDLISEIHQDSFSSKKVEKLQTPFRMDWHFFAAQLHSEQRSANDLY